MSTVPTLSREVLEDLYVNQQLGIDSIAKRFNSSRDTVSRTLRHHGIPIRKAGGSTSTLARVLTKALLQELYVNQYLTCENIAQRYGCGSTAVGRLLKRYAIPTRKGYSTVPARLRVDVPLTKDILEDLYVRQKLSLAAIGDHFGCSAEVVRVRLERHGIDLDTRRRCRERFGSGMTDLSGCRIGRLTVIERIPPPFEGYTKGSYWRCLCDCGNEVFTGRQGFVEKRTCYRIDACKDCRDKTYGRDKRRLLPEHDEDWTLSKEGYRTVTRRGVVYRQHRVVMERILGRSLLPNEIVHHVNGIRHDNRPENLELWMTNEIGQPYGQRVTDRIKDAVMILRLYAPEHLATDIG